MTQYAPNINPVDQQRKAIGRIIKAYRTNASLTVRELAEMSGVHKNTIWRIESGGGAYFRTIVAVVDTIGVRLSTVIRVAEELE